MKICHMTCVHGRHDIRILLKEAVTCSEYGYITYLVVDDNEEDEEFNQVKIVSTHHHPKSRIERMLFSAKKVYMTALRINADVYHFHDPELMRYGIKLKKNGKRVIFDSHEDVPEQIFSKYYIPRILRLPLSFFYKKMEEKSCKKLDYVIGATEKISSKFFRYGVATETVFNYPKFQEIKPHKKNELYSLCFAGGISKENGIIELISAIEGLPIQLILAGEVDPTVRMYAEKTKNVRYIGKISHNEVLELYSECHLGVVVDLPTGNNIEGLPIKMFEFMQAGLPFITSNYPLRKKILSEYRCGILVEPGNIQELREAIMKIYNDKELQRVLSNNGVRAVREKYNWEHEATKLISVYKEVFRNEYSCFSSSY